LSLGGYNLKSDSGWYHTTLSQIAQDHEIVSRLSKFVSLSQIAKIALDGNYVLASIKSLSGGHLLLIWGVRIDKGKLISFIVHDPNNYTYSGESKEISIESFNKLFTRRIIIFENKEGRSVKSDRV